MDITEVKKMVDELPLKAASKVYLHDLLLELVQSPSEKKGWFYRNELQGAINFMAADGIIDEQAHVALGEAFSELWKPLLRSFSVERINRSHSITDCMGELLKVARGLQGWINAVPDDVAASLPTMPGIDGDWALEVMDAAERAIKDGLHKG